MKSLFYLSSAFLCLMQATSCIEEDLDACPPVGGGVAITLRVEKFGTRPPYAPTDLEERFAARIHSLDYLLYADGRLIEQGNLGDAGSTDGDSYVFRHDTLPFGAYRLAFAANATPDVMVGAPDAPELYCIAYQDEAKSDDYFRGDLSFDITCPYRNEFETVLRRVHGVTRFRFENIPDGIDAVEVSLDHVGARTPLSGDPDRACTVSKRVRVEDLAARTAGSFTLATFSTLPGMKTSWRLRLYGSEEKPVYERIVTDTLRIESNQLIELATRFKESDLQGEIEFTVNFDTSWDGSNEGGGGEITVSKR